MPKQTTDITEQLKRERLKQFERSNLAFSKKIAKRKMKLDASQNALRIVEQAIGGKLVETKRRS